MESESGQQGKLIQGSDVVSEQNKSSSKLSSANLALAILNLAFALLCVAVVSLALCEQSSGLLPQDRQEIMHVVGLPMDPQDVRIPARNDGCYDAAAWEVDGTTKVSDLTGWITRSFEKKSQGYLGWNDSTGKLKSGDMVGGWTYYPKAERPQVANYAYYTLSGSQFPPNDSCAILFEKLPSSNWKVLPGPPSGVVWLKPKKKP